MEPSGWGAREEGLAILHSHSLAVTPNNNPFFLPKENQGATLRTEELGWEYNSAVQQALPGLTSVLQTLETTGSKSSRATAERGHRPNSDCCRRQRGFKASKPQGKSLFTHPMKWLTLFFNTASWRQPLYPFWKIVHIYLSFVLLLPKGVGAQRKLGIGCFESALGL